MLVASSKIAHKNNIRKTNSGLAICHHIELNYVIVKQMNKSISSNYPLAVQ